MKIASVLFTLVIVSSLHAQQEEKKATGKAANPAATESPTVRTASGVLRGVTEGDVSSFKGFRMRLHRSVNGDGVHLSRSRHGKEYVMQIGFVRTVHR